MKNNAKIVCLGGGIGTVNLISDLQNHVEDLTVIVSMADDGGSAGRLRRLYNIFPPGDLVSCMTVLSNHPNSSLQKLLRYRFPGNRYGRDNELSGQKLGNLIMVALRDITGDFQEAIRLFQDLFHVKGAVLPATTENVSISAKIGNGKVINGEERIDLGRYVGKRAIDRVFLEPENARTSREVVHAIESADVLIAGPGDLYTTTLPVLIVPQIKDVFIKSSAKKIFVVNVANKPFETKGYGVSDYVHAIEKHLGSFPFHIIIINNNVSIPIPEKYKYAYVKNDIQKLKEIASDLHVIEKDIVDSTLPIYHSPQKLAQAVGEAV